MSFVSYVFVSGGANMFSTDKGSLPALAHRSYATTEAAVEMISIPGGISLRGLNMVLPRPNNMQFQSTPPP